MKNVDIIIISDAKNEKLKKVTEDCIISLYQSDPDINFITYVVESSDSDFRHIHPNIIMVKPEPPFGYHKYLNRGRKIGRSEYVCLCNNDLFFHKNWATELIKEMENKGALSSSPVSRYPHFTDFNISQNTGVFEGYMTRKHVAGWCIFQKRSVYDIIGDLDERYVFWYCDDDYGMSLKANNIKHILVTSSRVDHITSQTLNTKNNAERSEYTIKQEAIFKRKWNIR